MEQNLAIIYQAIDRGVQKGIYTAQEVYNILHAYENVASAFISVPEEKKEEQTEETAK